jgi:DNA-binding MarR family transcriptional regulator
MTTEPDTIALDRYVLDVLMRDLVGHDKTPAAFIVYLYLAVRSEREMRRGIAASYGTIAAATGLSKSAVQHAIARLIRRRLVSAARTSATATPRYSLHRHWRVRGARRSA